MDQMLCASSTKAMQHATINSKLQALVVVAVVATLILISFLNLDNKLLQTNGSSLIQRKFERQSGDTDERLDFYVDNVVLTGKFNYVTDLQYVNHWVTRWRKMFQHVIVYGPFNETDVATLDQMGIQAFSGADDAGWYSQMTCMATTLRHFANDTSIVGVIVSHDDFIFNLTHLYALGFPSSDIIAPLCDPHALEEPMFVFKKNYTIRGEGHSEFIPTNDYRAILPDDWMWWSRTVPTFAVAVAEDSRATLFSMDNENFLMFHRSLSDFSYMPMIYAEQFANMADVLVDNKVFLEVAYPTILGLLRHKYNATVKFEDKCEGPWNLERNDYFNWTHTCFSRGAFLGYHPVKMGMEGLEMWDTYFNVINPPINDTKLK